MASGHQAGVSNRSAKAQRIAGRTVNNDLRAIWMVFAAARREGFIRADSVGFADSVHEGQKAGRETTIHGR